MYNSAVGERQHPDQRRQSLLEATARCLAARGAAGVSVRAICAEAAVSPGLLRHYFAGVSDAIAETYRWTGARVARALDEAVAAAGPPVQTRSMKVANGAGELLAIACGSISAMAELTTR